MGKILIFSKEHIHKFNITNHQEVQIKATIKYHLIPVKVDLSSKRQETSVGKDVEKRTHLCIVGGVAG